MSRAKYIFLLLLILVIGGVGFLLLPTRKPAPSSAPLVTAAEITLYGYTEEGTLAWEAHAVEGEILDNEGFLSRVTMRFIAEEAPHLTAAADHLVRGSDGSRLEGTVRIERDDGFHLQTDELRWNETTQALFADSIRLSFEDTSVEGGGFQYNLKTQRASLASDVNATIHRDEVLTIHGDRAEESEGTFVIQGNVEADFPGGTLSAQLAKIDSTGLSASGDVSLRLDLRALEGQDGA